MIRRFAESSPRIHRTAYIHPSSEIIGRVQIGKEVSIWPMVVLRGDIEWIRIGARCNVQDATVMHTSHGLPVSLGAGVTVGHSAVIHGARIAPYCLIGMGAILLDGCQIGTETLIGAGAVVSQHAKIPPRSLVLGVPGRVVRPLRKEEIAEIHRRARDYVRYANQHRRGSSAIERSSFPK